MSRVRTQARDLRRRHRGGGRRRRRAATSLPDQPGVYLFKDAEGRGPLRRQGDLDPQAGGRPLLGQVRDPRLHRPGRVDRLPGHGERGRGAARRAAVHQAPPAAVQHPPARRQVLPLHRDQRRRGVPARLLHPRAPPLRPAVLRPLLERQAHPRDARAARQAVPVPHLRRARAGPALGRALPRLLHQALPGALRRLHRPRGVPAQHRGDRRLPLRPLPRRRARPRAQDGRGRRPPRSSSGRRSTATAWRRCAR